MTAAEHRPWHFDRMDLRYLDDRRFFVYQPRPVQVARWLRLLWWRLARRQQVLRTRIHLMDGSVDVWAVDSRLWMPPARVRRLR